MRNKSKGLTRRQPGGIRRFIAKYFWRSLLVGLHCGIIYLLFEILLRIDAIAYLMIRSSRLM